jgi:hypothetical protein
MAGTLEEAKLAPLAAQLVEGNRALRAVIEP